MLGTGGSVGRTSKGIMEGSVSRSVVGLVGITVGGSVGSSVIGDSVENSVTGLEIGSL